MIAPLGQRFWAAANLRTLQRRSFAHCGRSTTDRARQQDVEVDAVLKAAAKWLTAQEALVAARQRSEETTTQREAADIAGSQLVVVVARWRTLSSSKMDPTNGSTAPLPSPG
jgi:hypothetical protein